MATFAIVSSLLGAVLGLRFKVLVLVPVIAAGLLLIVGRGLLLHDTLIRLVLEVVVAATCLELGYLCGVGIGCFLVVARVRQLSPTPQRTPQPDTGRQPSRYS